MEPHDRLCALVVDDDNFVRSFVCEALKSRGFEVHSAEDGTTALALYDAQPRIGLIVTDILMPTGDGIDFILKVRRRGGDRAQPKIIAISGGGVVRAELYLEDARGLGADATLTKPFSSGELMQAVSRVGLRGAWSESA